MICKELNYKNSPGEYLAEVSFTNRRYELIPQFQGLL
jgi:hypothetical protein